MADKLARKRAAPILAGCSSNAANANYTGMAGATNQGWYNWPVCRLTICAHHEESVVIREAALATRHRVQADGDIAGNVERRQRANHVTACQSAQGDCRQVFHIPSTVAQMQGCPDPHARRGIASLVPRQRSAGQSPCMC